MLSGKPPCGFEDFRSSGHTEVPHCQFVETRVIDKYLVFIQC